MEKGEGKGKGNRAGKREEGKGQQKDGGKTTAAGNELSEAAFNDEACHPEGPEHRRRARGISGPSCLTIPNPVHFPLPFPPFPVLLPAHSPVDKRKITFRPCS